MRLRQRKTETAEQAIIRFAEAARADERRKNHIATLRQERETALHQIRLAESVGPDGKHTQYLIAFGGQFLNERTGKELGESGAESLAAIDAEIERVTNGGEF
jgi:hypothetical protein